MTWTLLTVFAALMLLDIVMWHRLFSRAIARPSPPAPPLDRYPSVSVIRPIRGVDRGQRENLRAALDTGYPGEVETIFVFDDETDPGLPQTKAAIAEHEASGGPGVARVALAGPPPPGQTGKLNAMILGERMAKGELIAFGDSDTRPDRDVLRILVETLMRGAPRVGCTFAPVAAVGPKPTSGDAGYQLMLNGLYGPTVARAAGDTGELPFIMGQIMVFHRQALKAIGGVECAAGQLVDDMYIGLCMVEAGYANVMIKHPLHVVIGGLSFTDFLKTYRRWIMFSRNGLSLAFTWPLWVLAFQVFASTALAGFAVAAGQTATALLSLAALLAQGISLDRLQLEFSGQPVRLRHKWMPWAFFFLAPAVLASMAKRNVGWRGRTYELALTTRLKADGEQRRETAQQAHQ